ncbi:MAG: S-layer homology domain-containing protein [Oscillospiraceae bacterium]|nr:S-layer homology domain-containing protein [Oscillospiraceae bacterium]
MKKKLCRVVPLMLITVLLLSSWTYATGKPYEIGESAQIPIVEFEDVFPDDWFYRYVLTGIRFGIIQGVSEENFRFEPERAITRAEFITMLGRLYEYGNDINGTLGEGMFYERYLEWAAEMKIIQGNENGYLMPRSFTTREQMAVIVDRFIQVFELRGCFSHNAVRPPYWYSDDDEISSWARQSIGNIFHFGIISTGLTVGDGRMFRPRENVSRADAVASLSRMANVMYEACSHPFCLVEISG